MNVKSAPQTAATPSATPSAIPFLAARAKEAPAWVAALQEAMPEERIVADDALDASERQSATLAIVANPDPAELAQFPRLRWVHSVWAGVERLVADLGTSGITIVRLIDPALTATMSEAVLAWTLYLHREMPAYARQQKEEVWRAHRYVPAGARTVGLLGLGELGAASAARLVAAGFRVCGWSRQRKSLAQVECYAGEAELATMLARSDILVCLLPLTPSTRGLVGEAALACLPKGAALINFARGAIVDAAALRAALDSGALEHAVLDVFVQEPLPPGEWQWQHPRVTVLPHCSAPTSYASAAAIVAESVRRYRASGKIPAGVDPDLGY